MLTEMILCLMTMAKMKSMTKIIFFDTDCISSFLWTKTEHLLIHCFGDDMIIPTQVYSEISRVPHLRKQIDDLVNDGYMTVEAIQTGSEENKVYAALTDHTKVNKLPLIGRGEAAAIVLSKKYKGVLASNNLRDVKYYVDLYNLNHVTTADIIHKVVKDGLLTIFQADEIWIQMINKRRKLPFDTYSLFLDRLLAK